MANLLTAPYSAFFDGNGAPLAGGKVYTYLAGSGYATPKATYTDSGGGTPLANPVVLDSAGQAAIWLVGSYGIVVKDALGNTVRSVDNISGNAGTAAGENLGSVIIDDGSGNLTIGSSQVTGAMIASSAALAGSPTTTTPVAGENSTKIATTAFVAGISKAAVINGFLITGLTGNSTTAGATITGGQCTDSTNGLLLSSGSHAWAAVNGNAVNGTDAPSSTLANSTTYHMYKISGTGGEGVFATTTIPAITTTFPVNYRTSWRRIGSFNTDGSGNPIPYTSIEVEGGATENYLATQTLDISVTNLGATAVLYTMNTPLGVKCRWLGRVREDTGNSVIVTSPDESDVAPIAGAGVTVPMSDVISAASGPAAMNIDRITDTSGRIRARASASTTHFYAVTRGWVDFRRI